MKNVKVWVALVAVTAGTLWVTATALAQTGTLGQLKCLYGPGGSYEKCGLRPPDIKNEG